MTTDELGRDLRRIVEEHKRRWDAAKVQGADVPDAARAERAMRLMNDLTGELDDLLFRMDA